MKLLKEMQAIKELEGVKLQFEVADEMAYIVVDGENSSKELVESYKSIREEVKALMSECEKNPILFADKKEKINESIRALKNLGKTV